MDDYQGMRCARVLPILSAEIDGEADRIELIAVAAHLERCPSCRAWMIEAVKVTRRARLRCAERVPDLTEAIIRRVLGP